MDDFLERSDSFSLFASVPSIAVGLLHTSELPSGAFGLSTADVFFRRVFGSIISPIELSTTVDIDDWVSIDGAFALDGRAIMYADLLPFEIRIRFRQSFYLFSGDGLQTKKARK